MTNTHLDNAEGCNLKLKKYFPHYFLLFSFIYHHKIIEEVHNEPSTKCLYQQHIVVLTNHQWHILFAEFGCQHKVWRGYGS
jgi:hypothetical protein